MSKIVALVFALGFSAPLAAMAPRPTKVQSRIQLAASLWRAADVSACAAILEPLAWSDPQAGREWAAFLFLQQRYVDVESFFASTPGAEVKDDEARLWLARAQVARSHFLDAGTTLQSLSQSAQPLALALSAEIGSWPGTWSKALSACSGTRWEASTALVAGEQALAANALSDAEQLFKKAEKADPAYSLVHARLAQLYHRQGRFADERSRLQRALRVDPDSVSLRAHLNQLLAQHSDLRVSGEKEAQLAVQRFLKRENPRIEPHPAKPGEPLVRVGLFDTAPRFRLKLGGAYWVEGQDRTLTANSAWEARLGAQGGWDLRPLSPNAEFKVNFSQVLRLNPIDAKSTFGIYDVDSGAGYFWAGKEDRYYRGVAELRPQKAQGITVVNELGLEAYLLSVVPSEAFPRWPLAALEAQAVAARTDAWRSLGRFASKGYDLCPTVACAVYSGVGSEHPRSTFAVTKTAGMVLEGPGKRLHPTFYMDHSGGYTQEPFEAWTEAKANLSMAGPDAAPHAKVRKLFPVTPASLLHYLDDLDGDIDVWARKSNNFRWTLRFSATEADDWVGRRHPVTPLRSVLPLERSVGGYVERVLFVGETATSVGSSDYIRSALKGMKSNLFYPELRQDEQGNLKALLLHGGGWGHGVGMAQEGAKAQAEAGRSAEQILRSYFPQARLKRRYPGL